MRQGTVDPKEILTRPLSTHSGVKHCHRWSRSLIRSPILETIKAHQDEALINLLELTPLQAGGFIKQYPEVPYKLNYPMILLATPHPFFFSS